MKRLNTAHFRTVFAAILAVVTGCLLFAGIPALAAEVGTTNANARPIAENLSYTTYKGIAITGRFSASDPEGDAVLFEVTDLPKKGTIRFDSAGTFVYTPGENKKGQDVFSYLAVDDAGNLSQKATVTIDIDKQSTKLTYADMADNPAHYAALVLAEKGLLVGEKIGDQYFFRPQAAVTRGEFLTMCLGMTDVETLRDITRTGFSDDAAMPDWVKPYVSTALLSGYVTGYKNEEGRLVFGADKAITAAEAAVILNNILDISDVASVAAVSSDSCPVWAYQAEVNLAACNIIEAPGAGSYNTAVSRAEAADMFVSAMALQDARGGTSLLSWALK
ncbi:S-layer homology domain-containing protein [Oscillospiraceae bacterium CM]|nr:S-layer homology domain-containing protein [Oscillospiraceae bacterium CM]